MFFHHVTLDVLRSHSGTGRLVAGLRFERGEKFLTEELPCGSKPFALASKQVRNRPAAEPFDGAGWRLTAECTGMTKLQ